MASCTRSTLSSAVHHDIRKSAVNSLEALVRGTFVARCLSSSAQSTAAATTADDETNKPQTQHSSSSSSHFATLGIQPSFAINRDDLKSTYKTLMNELHPDRHMGKTDAEMEALHDSASAVTRAFEELSKPHLRAMHLLDISGLPLDENDSGELVGNEFLMTIMMVRENVEDANSDEKLQQLLKENDDRVQQCCVELDAAFEAGDYATAKKLSAQLQYWSRVEETIKENVDSVH